MNKGRNTQNYNNSVEAPTRGFLGQNAPLPLNASIEHPRGIVGHFGVSLGQVNHLQKFPLEKSMCNSYHKIMEHPKTNFFLSNEEPAKTLIFTSKNPYRVFWRQKVVPLYVIQLLLMITNFNP